MLSLPNIIAALLGATAAYAQTLPPAVVSTIHPMGHPSKCVDVRGALFENGTPVQIYDCNGTNAQKWEIIIGGGWQNIRLAGTDFCLDGGLQYNIPGSKFKIWQCYDGLAQQSWSVPALTSNDRRIVNRDIYYGPDYGRYGMCVDLTDGSTANGNQLQTWPNDTPNNPNLQWDIVPVPV